MNNITWQHNRVGSQRAQLLDVSFTPYADPGALRDDVAVAPCVANDCFMFYSVNSTVVSS